MTSNYKVSLKKENDKLEIIFSGQLIIYNIDKIIAETKDEILKAKSISINVKDVENLDLTFIQFLYSVKLSAKRNNIDFNIDIKLPEELSLLVKNAGFINIFE